MTSWKQTWMCDLTQGQVHACVQRLRCYLLSCSNMAQERYSALPGKELKEQVCVREAKVHHEHEESKMWTLCAAWHIFQPTKYQACNFPIIISLLFRCKAQQHTLNVIVGTSLAEVCKHLQVNHVTFLL